MASAAAAALSPSGGATSRSCGASRDTRARLPAPEPRARHPPGRAGKRPRGTEAQEEPPPPPAAAAAAIFKH